MENNEYYYLSYESDGKIIVDWCWKTSTQDLESETRKLERLQKRDIWPGKWKNSTPYNYVGFVQEIERVTEDSLR